MKFLVVFSAVLAFAAARPGLLAAPWAAPWTAPLGYVAPVLPLSSQYHAQDSLGQYNYGYSAPLSSKVESRAFDGSTSGAYSYVDAEGKLQSVSYTADAVNGFKVKATNLPVAPEAPVVPKLEEPKPVEDTAEVASAKADHSAAIEAIKARDAAIVSSDPGDVLVPQVYTAYSAPLSYVHPVSYYHAPAVYSVPFLYTNGHQVSELPKDDEAVAQAKAEHEKAHAEAKAKLVEAGVQV